MTATTEKSWVEEQTGMHLSLAATAASIENLGDSIEIALRDNPRRAQLLVSRLLGKHIPVPAATVLRAGFELGVLARDACGGTAPIVLGFAETAIGLGRAVAGSFERAAYIHTTRRPVPPDVSLIEFREEHSHATEHLLAIRDETVLRTDAPLVLVDDEISTGRTAVNAVRALQARWPRSHYILASLLDTRSAAQHEQVVAAICELGATVTSVAGYLGVVALPEDILERAERLRASLPPAAKADDSLNPVAVHYASSLPRELRARLNDGLSNLDSGILGEAVGYFARQLPVFPDDRTLVLGDEEFIYFPQLLARALGQTVYTSSTTRTPAIVIDEPGYPLRSELQFAASNEPARLAHAYNVAPSRQRDKGNAPGFDDIVLVTDAPITPHLRDDLIAQLVRVARRAVYVVSTALNPNELGADQ